MDKLGYPKGLIRYTTENSLDGKPSRIMRPRLVGYIVAVVVMTGLLGYKIVDRDTLELSVLRDRQSLYVENSQGGIDNIYTIKVANKTQQNHRYQLSVSAPYPLQWVGAEEVEVLSGEVVELPITLRTQQAGSLPAHFDVTFNAEPMDTNGDDQQSESRFFTPGPPR